MWWAGFFMAAAGDRANAAAGGRHGRPSAAGDRADLPDRANAAAGGRHSPIPAQLYRPL